MKVDAIGPSACQVWVDPGIAVWELRTVCCPHTCHSQLPNCMQNGVHIWMCAW